MVTTDIAKKVASSALTRREKKANREAVKELAGKHMEAAIKKLGEIISDRNAPASAKVAAATQLLDRVAGKPKLVDEKQSEQSMLEKMSAPELAQYITEQISGLTLPVRALIAESAEKGLAFDAADLADLTAEVEMEPQAQGLPPLQATPKPKKEPRR
jgi:hypothetical protein